jgi:hypothetical protein
VAIGFPAKYVAEIETDRPVEEVIAAVSDALSRLRWGSTLCDGVFYASRTISWWSWGEEVIVDCNQPGYIVVESRSSLPQVIDWGRNRRNTEALFRALRI